MAPRKKVQPKAFTPNPEQELVVSSREGFFKVLSGPGSGKSACLVNRYVRLVESGVSPDDILSLTFTSSAAKSMRDRAEALVPVQKTDRVSGWMTFHSLALRFCEHERDSFPFKLAESVLLPEPLANKVASDAAKKYDIDFRALRSFISLQKRNRVRPKDALKEAEKAGKGEKSALAYKQYDARLREIGQLDFDSMIQEMVELLRTPPRGKETPERFALTQRWQYKFVQIDESQDCDQLQYDLVKLLSSAHQNVLFVGDAGQCQPPDTLVSVPDYLGKNIYTHKQVPISEISVGMKVVSWDRRKASLKKQGRTVTGVENRPYSGQLVCITSNGFTTKTTPEHKLWVTLETSVLRHVVYLMWKEEFGFRVGMCKTSVGADNRNGMGGISGRCYEERADRGWILGVYETKEEAHEEELVKAAKYGLPTCVFVKQNHHAVTEKTLRKIFSVVPKERGFKCLQDHFLLFQEPLFNKNSRPNSRYFTTAACNLIPKIMRLPVPEDCKSAVIDAIDREHYEGDVYSLNVEDTHTYIADGIPVRNCLYSFRGANNELFLHLEKVFPGCKTLYLAQNYRSTPEVTAFCKAVGPVPDLAEKFFSTNPHGPEPVITRFASNAQEAEAVAKLVQEGDGSTSAILARTNRGLRPLEDHLSLLGVPYHLLGKSGFWSQPEIRVCLGYLACTQFPSDGAVKAALSGSFHPSRYIRKTELKKALEKKPEDKSVMQFLARHPDEAVSKFVHFLDRMRRYRDHTPKDALTNLLSELKAYEYYKEEENADNSPVENLQELQRLSTRYSSIKEFVAYTIRASHASKNKRGVCLATIHAAKGSEAESVYVVAVQDGILPHAKAESLAEEANCFFVAVSRAKTNLHISYAGQPSQFLAPFLKTEVEEMEEVFA